MSCLSTAATVSAEFAAAGAPTARLPKLFPAATTNRVPCCSLRLSAARLAGSVPSVSICTPTLMLTIGARAAAHSMPWIIQDIWPNPEASMTFETASVASGATPR